MTPAEFDPPSNLPRCTIKLPFDVPECGAKEGDWLYITPNHPVAPAWKIQPITRFYPRPGGRFRSLLDLVLCFAGRSPALPAPRSLPSSAARHRLLRLLN